MEKGGAILSAMQVLVTAGGTKEPIDAVRVLSNVSTGALGRAIAEEWKRRGHRVVLLAPAEVDATVEKRTFGSADDLQRELEWAAAERTWDAVIHAAAVSDYRPAKVEPGKIRSDQDELVLRLVRTPKLIARLREWFRDAYLVGFKLLKGVAADERVEIAREQIRANRTNACVENDLSEFGPGEHKARVVTLEQIVDIPKGDKPAVARGIVDFVEAHVPRH